MQEVGIFQFQKKISGEGYSLFSDQTQLLVGGEPTLHPFSEILSLHLLFISTP